MVLDDMGSIRLYNKGSIQSGFSGSVCSKF